MSRRIKVPIALLLCLVGPSPYAAEGAPPQRELKTYSLGNNPNSADFSPDEKLLVIECTAKEDVRPEVQRFSELVQLWDFTQGTLIRQALIQSADVNASTKGQFRGPIADQRFVRFSADGSFVLVYADHLLYVLRADDLSEVRRIAVAGPPSLSRQIHSKRYGESTYVEKPIVRAFEPAPRGNIAALLWSRDMLNRRLELYDVSTGQQVGAWDAPKGWSSGKRGLAWDPSGSMLLLAIPSGLRCMSPVSIPDVFAFAVPSGEIKTRLTTGLLVGDIAVTADHRVFAVDNNCMTLWNDHHPKMKVFDLGTGKHLRDLRGRDTGVRYAVATSREGDRVIAWTGRLKINFDWVDMVSHDARVDETFSIWDSRTYEGIATSRNMPELDPRPCALVQTEHTLCPAAKR
jgi:WD40 repeat protein